MTEDPKHIERRAAGRAYVEPEGVEPLDPTPVSATLVVVAMFLACLIGSLTAIGIIR